jgi:phosphonoacetate hydrolase
MSKTIDMSRRQFLGTASAAPLAAVQAMPIRARAPKATRTPQRVCVVLFDGFGTDYYETSTMPTLRQWAKNGFHKRIRAVMPSVTNTNMAGVCCGVYAEEHGITGNSYWDADAEQERFMSDGSLLSAATLFQRAARFGVRSMLISAKQKSVSLLKQGTSLAIGSQDPPAEIVKKYGRPPDIYSADVNYWVWSVAVDLIKTQPKVGLFFVHTTDYPMHKFAPESGDSRAHLRKIGEFLASAADADPDLAFFVAPDHGLNAKTTVLNLNKMLARKGAQVQIVMSAERDQYPKHHSGFGGTAFVYLKSPADADKVIKVLRDVPEIEEILTREEAARKYQLNPHRIGDLWLTAVKDVVFGHSTEEREQLARNYRSHGSSHELEIPCFIHRYAGKLPDPARLLRMWMCASSCTEFDRKRSCLWLCCSRSCGSREVLVNPIAVSCNRLLMRQIYSPFSANCRPA